ncbi:hypothetical protein GQ54DRAFT_150112 [Martensiomyces pterosporus]|nr:hypothetical protein GQ54DRAFT_150112 [Martensiomyces pterosporus]
MREGSLYSYPATYSDDTIYSPLAIDTTASSESVNSHAKGAVANYHPHMQLQQRYSLHQQQPVDSDLLSYTWNQQQQQQQQQQQYQEALNTRAKGAAPYSGHSAGCNGDADQPSTTVERRGLRGSDNNASNNKNNRSHGMRATASNVSPAKPSSLPLHKPQHARSGSSTLLSRFKQSSAVSSSPTSSPTSSDSSSRGDSRSERTLLAHSRSSGSIRHQHVVNVSGTQGAHTNSAMAGGSTGDLELQQEGSPSLEQPQRRPSVRVLPPAPHTDGNLDGLQSKIRRSGKKRHSFRGDGKAGGFISQLLRAGHSKSRTLATPHAEPSQKSGAVSEQHDRSPHTASGNPRYAMSVPASSPSQRVTDHQQQQYTQAMQQQHSPSVALHAASMQRDAGSSPRFGAPESQRAISFQHFHHQQQMQALQSFSRSDGGSESESEVSSRPSSYLSASDRHHYSDESLFTSRRHPQPSSNDDDVDSLDGDTDVVAADVIDHTLSSVWCEDDDDDEAESLRVGSRLLSSIPIYEPINMSRATAQRSQNGSRPRATRPTLPDINMLAPMASLAGTYAADMGAHDVRAALSNRELRFAVENHMLVEQHRYLIRDLGHARSAITALKQVVQAKEDRVEQYEVANIELQQRVAILESILTHEQRLKLATCLPFSFDAHSSQSPFMQLAQQSLQQQDQSQQQQQQAQRSEGESGMRGNLADSNAAPPGTIIPHQRLDTSSAGDNVAPTQSSAAHARTQSSVQQNVSHAELSIVEHTARSQSKRSARPLSGVPAGFAFSDRPMQHLPRVFSGDYSTVDVESMESSMEALATAITAPPADNHSVEEIIAGKLAIEQEQHQQLLLQSVSSGMASSSDHERETMEDAQMPAAATDDLDKRSGRAWTKQKASTKSAEPKRRSRFFAALRLPSFHTTATPADSAATSATRNDDRAPSSSANVKRRSVSLSSSRPAAARTEASGSAGSGAVERLHAPGSHQHASAAVPSQPLAASCPILHHPESSAGGGENRVSSGKARTKRQPSADSVGSSCSSGRYPAGLGLSASCTPAVAPRSNSSSGAGASTDLDAEKQHGLRADDRRRWRESRFSRRLSFTPQPRRSTSEPSRPQSMRLTSRRSWISQLFGGDAKLGGEAVSSASASDSESAADVHAGDDARARRRRVVTHSTDEISRFLGKLTLEGHEGGGQHAVGSVLEDVADLSDEEDSGRVSLSVAAIRQQTLDALNGTLRGSHSSGAPPAPTSPAAAAEGSSDLDMAEPRRLRVSSLPHWLSDKNTRDLGLSPPQKPARDNVDTRSSSSFITDQELFLDHSIIRWRQRESSAPTIKCLNPPPSSSAPPSSSGVGIGALGLGVSVGSGGIKTGGSPLAPARRSSCPSTSPVALVRSLDSTAAPGSFVDEAADGFSRDRRSLSLPGGSDPKAFRSGMSTQSLAVSVPVQEKKAADASTVSDAAAQTSASKWAPGFWAPPSLSTHAVSAAACTAPGASWSPRGSMESFESGSIGSRLSDDVRYRSPCGSAGLGASSRSSNRRGSSSPWELVKFSEARTFPLSPSHSRPGTPPPGRAHGFFEETTVPDSDELTAAARRSLSLRMSRNAFKQAEPLPETDDLPAASHQRLPLLGTTLLAGGTNAIAGIGSVLSPSTTAGGDAGDNPHGNGRRHRQRYNSGAANSPGKARASAAEAADQPLSSSSSNRRSLLKQLNLKAGGGGGSHALGGYPEDESDDGRSLHSRRPMWATAASDSGNDNQRLRRQKSSSNSSSSSRGASDRRSKKWWSAVLG